LKPERGREIEENVGRGGAVRDASFKKGMEKFFGSEGSQAVPSRPSGRGRLKFEGG
jgi:hypothetical protein